MIKLRVRSIKIRRWFPPNDQIATAVATLCILREDFFLELQGMVSDEIVPLDGNAAAYRRTYFWRNSLRTLVEIQKTLNALNALRDFRLAMGKEPADVQEAFANGRRALNRACDRFLTDLRNKLGGHLDLSRVQAGLDSIEQQHEGMAQLGNTRENTHYKFAVEIVWAAVLKQGVSSTSGTDIERVLGDTAALSLALAAVDDVIAWYVRRL